jgi:hypothetical protein
MEWPRYLEKRKQPRQLCNLPNEYSWIHDGYRGGMAVNLSEGGLLSCSMHDITILFAEESRLAKLK